MINELIESHLEYAHAIAAKLVGRYPPSITRADLNAAAEFGLVQAAHSYDPSRNASFTTFAFYRIQGAILDEVRKSWQATHSKSPRVDVSVPVESSGSSHQDETVHDSPNDPSLFSGSRLLSLEDVQVQQISGTTDSPASTILREEELKSIRKALERLPKRHRFVVWAHYFEERSLASIGVQLNLSKSWVSRIHSQALTMIRDFLKDTQRMPISRSGSYIRKQTAALQATFCHE